MDSWIIILVVVLIPVKIIFWCLICYRIINRRQQTVIVQRNITIQSDQIQGQPGQLVQMPSGEIVRVNIDADMQPPPYHPGQAGMMPYSPPGRPVDHDPRVGISQKTGLVDQAY